MSKRDFHLAPPDSVSVEVFEWSHDRNGNPTAHHLILWSNGLTGDRHAGGHYRSKRRAQVGYGDKVTGGVMPFLEEYFPGTRWKIAGEIRGDRSAGRAFFDAVRVYGAEPVPVLFRAERSGDFAGDVTAVFPTLPGTADPNTFQVYAHVGQHGSGVRDWYNRTRAARPEEYADLRRELESAPFNYVLDVRKRWSRDFDDKRRADLEIHGAEYFRVTYGAESAQ